MQKFFFDLNVFDENEDEVDPDAPPPPIYTEDQMQQAQKQSFEQGRTAGLQEAKTAREQNIATQIAGIARTLQMLITEEAARAALYEAEAVRTAMRAFETCFPFLHAQGGLQELKAAMQSILSDQEQQKKITVLVCPDYKDAVEQELLALRTNGMENIILVEPDEALAPGACRVQWADGGGVRDAQATASRVLEKLQQVLAGAPSTGHDNT